jgi:HEPN domain-containing protein
MNKGKPQQRLAREWFESANSDYLYAKVGISEDRVFPQVGFLAQQVGEKYLKGFLVYNGIEPPRIHDLPKLLDKCIEFNKKLEDLRDACELLTGFYIETRYPPDIPDYTKEEIILAIEAAKDIKTTIEVLTEN